MKPEKDIKKYFQNSTLSTNPDKHEAIFEKILSAHEKANQQAPAQPVNIGRIIMKSPIVKLTAAAIIILAVLGLFEFIGTESTSGVVWADVVRKVQASRGLIVRSTDIKSSGEGDYSITYTSPQYSRKDFYENRQIIRTGYVDFTASDTNTLIDVFHKNKLSLTTTFKKSEYELFLEWHNDWTNPGFLVQKILSVDHIKLGQETIEGVLCEGIETTDPACLGPLPAQINNLQVEFRLWVSTETGYPVLYENKISGEYEGQRDESGCIMDQFQWNIELDPAIFEPIIPPDYEEVTRPGVIEP